MLPNNFRKAAIPVALLSLGIAFTAIGQGTTGGTSGSGASGSSGASKSSTPGATSSSTAQGSSSASGSGSAAGGASSASGKSSGSSSSTSKGSSAQLAGADRTFVEKAAKGGMAEVEMGKVAQQKASDSQVKSFAGRMVTDHTKANDELKSIAGNKGVTLPTTLDKDHQKDSEKMQRLQGPEFDREYMKHMVTDHKKTVADFEKQAKSGKDDDVKQFAAKNLPTIQEHLKMAQQIEQSTKNSKGGSSSSKSGAQGSSGK